MKLAFATIASCLFASLASAEDAPTGRYAFDKEASLAALNESGKATDAGKAGLEMLRESTLDFTDAAVQINLAEGMLIAKCKWDADDQGAIKLSNCVDAENKPSNDVQTNHIDWMDDDSLEVVESDGSKVVYRKK